MTEWKMARKKPVVIEFREVLPAEKAYTYSFGDMPDALVELGEWTTTREGKLFAKAGKDYIIKGVDGETYPIAKEIFKKTYEVIE
jgi:hypothetical protein